MIDRLYIMAECYLSLFFSPSSTRHYENKVFRNKEKKN